LNVINTVGFLQLFVLQNKMELVYPYQMCCHSRRHSDINKTVPSRPRPRH